MKNIHVLPTENESRIRYNSFNKVYELCEFPKYHTDIKSTHNIYITSNEEIKEGDWYYDLDTKYVKIKQSWENSHLEFNAKKIILTTDQDLIKDGVQVIDDEFLEWFVKNPSCEEVGFSTYHVKGDISGKLHYQIIIPKEEAKQDLEKEMFELEQELNIPSNLRWHNSKPKLETIKEGGKINPLLMDEIGQFKFLPKQETTSEGFHRISKEFDYSEFDFVSFKIGTEWQQEQFSKSEFLQKLRGTLSDAEARRLIFEQFKNK